VLHQVKKLLSCPQFVVICKLWHVTGVREYLNERFLGQWIRRECLKRLSPLSPELTPLLLIAEL
jgi:hypothetical protein